MALTDTPLPYGLREVVLTPYTTAAATVLGTPVTLPYARTFAFTAAEEFTELRGDDHVVTTHGQGESIDWSLEAGGISFEAYKILAGGTIVESGTTPNQKKILKKGTSDIRPWFKVEGRAISDAGGDFHAEVWKARATGNLGGTLADTTFMLSGASGVGVPSTKTGAVGDLYWLTENETAVAII